MPGISASTASPRQTAPPGRRISYLAVNPVVLVPQLDMRHLRIIAADAASCWRPSSEGQPQGHLRRGGRHCTIVRCPEPSSNSWARGSPIPPMPRALRLRRDQDYRHFVIRVSRVGYYGRHISVDHDKGRELSIFLSEYKTGSLDWANSREAGGALADLATRLAMEPRRTRMTREELARYGTMALCEIPRIRSQAGRDPPSSCVARPGCGPTLCAWTADQVDLLEWGGDPCKEAYKSIAQVLSIWCGPSPGRMFPSLYATIPERRPGYVVVWPRS
jgi:hypothetical protein